MDPITMIIMAVVAAASTYMQQEQAVKITDELTEQAEQKAALENAGILSDYEQEQKSAVQKESARLRQARRARASIMAASAAAGTIGGTIDRTLSVEKINTGMDMGTIAGNYKARKDKLFIGQAMRTQALYQEVQARRHSLPNDFTRSLQMFSSASRGASAGASISSAVAKA